MQLSPLYFYGSSVEQFAEYQTVLLQFLHKDE